MILYLMKKLLDLSQWKAWHNTLNAVIALCVDRPNCIGCPLNLKSKDKYHCLIPVYYENGSSINTAYSMMYADHLKLKEHSRIRQRVLFDETK